MIITSYGAEKMTVNRKWLTEKYNKEQGSEHKSKTICASAVAGFFNADGNVRYLQTVSDIVRAVRKHGYTVRSRRSSVQADSVGGIRKELKKLGEGYYIVRVEGHALLLDHNGQTVVDTCPRKRDRRKITHLYKVF